MLGVGDAQARAAVAENGVVRVEHALVDAHPEPLADRVEATIRRHDLIPPGGEVACLVSGGAVTAVDIRSSSNNLSDAVFVQAQTTRGRLTLHGAARFDRARSWFPVQEEGPSRFLPVPIVIPETPGVDSYKDITPRLGASYDLSGNGKTAFKVSLGRYTAKLGTEIPETNNPIATSVTTVSRVWTDGNSNYVPDCNLGDFAANGECGAISNQNFGKNNPRATRYADDVLRGFGGHLAEHRRRAGLTQSALADLADADLEQRMIDVLTRRLEELDERERKTLTESLRKSGNQVIVRTAFELRDETREKLLQALRNGFSDEVSLQSEVSPDLLCGIEVSVQDHKLAWTCDDYLASLETSLFDSLEGETAYAG